MEILANLAPGKLGSTIVPEIRDLKISISGSQTIKT